MDEELQKEIKKTALQNAFEHGGETRDKIVLGKILGAKPEFRSKVKEISADIAEIVFCSKPNVIGRTRKRNSRKFSRNFEA